MDTPIKTASLSTSRSQVMTPSLKSAENTVDSGCRGCDAPFGRLRGATQNTQSFVRGKGSPRRRARRQRVGGVRLAPIIPFYSILSNFYTFSEQFLYLFGVVFTQKGIGYSDQNHFAQRVTFASTGHHDSIVGIRGSTADSGHRGRDAPFGRPRGARRVCFPAWFQEVLTDLSLHNRRTLC